MWFVFSLLAVLCWSVPIVLDSVLVKNFTRHPFVLMWTQSCISLIVLSVAVLFVPLQSVWIPWIAVGSVTAYIGDVVLFVILDRIDASVVNIAWAFLAVFLSVVGFLFFQESWSFSQTVGAVCILAGVVFLSCTHRHITLSAIGFLVLLGALYTPTNAIQKAAVHAGEFTSTVVFWQLLSREVLSFLFPWCLPSFRRAIRTLPSDVNLLHFGVVSFLVICGFFSGMFFVAEAYRTGPLSLVSIVGNIQPFTVLFLGWILWLLVPRYSSKELLDGRSVSLKLGSFAVVFIGLSLLAIS